MGVYPQDGIEGGVSLRQREGSFARIEVGGDVDDRVHAGGMGACDYSITVGVEIGEVEMGMCVDHGRGGQTGGSRTASTAD